MMITAAAGRQGGARDQGPHVRLCLTRLPYPPIAAAGRAGPGAWGRCEPWPRLQCRLGIWPLLALLSHSQIKKAPHSALSLHRAALEGRRTAERASIQIQGNPSVLVRHRFACTSFRSSIIGRMPGSARENWTAFLFAESGSGSHGNWNLRF
jgi:hypothetical protein